MVRGNFRDWQRRQTHQRKPQGSGVIDPAAHESAAEELTRHFALALRMVLAAMIRTDRKTWSVELVETVEFARILIGPDYGDEELERDLEELRTRKLIPTVRELRGRLDDARKRRLLTVAMAIAQSKNATTQANEKLVRKIMKALWVSAEEMHRALVADGPGAGSA